MRKVLIIGGNGFLGSHLAEEFARDSAVFVTVRSSSDQHRLQDLQESISIVDLDVTPLSESIKQHCFDLIVNAAVSYGRGEKGASRVMNCNLALPVEALETATHCGCSCFINSDSFFSRIPDPYPYLPEYRLAKKQLHDWLVLFGDNIQIANVQIEHMYGERDSAEKFLPAMISQILAEVPTIDLTPGLQERDFVHVSDVARAFHYIADSSGKAPPGLTTFQVGTGESHSIKDTLILVRELAESKSDLRFGQLPYREGECMQSVAAIEEVKQLGWSPQVSWRQGMNDLVAYFKQLRAHA